MAKITTARRACSLRECPYGNSKQSFHYITSFVLHYTRTLGLILAANNASMLSPAQVLSEDLLITRADEYDAG